jgi:hypothetical protein
LGQLKKRERPSLQDPSSGPINTRNKPRKIEELRTKRRKVLYEVEQQKFTGQYPVFKPVSLSGFQIGADNQLHVILIGA